MFPCYEHVLDAIESLSRLVGEPSDSSFHLNEQQCRILVEEVVETNTFLREKSDNLKFVGRVECISLQHLCTIVKRAEVLVSKCCCKDSRSWLTAAVMLVEIQEECVAIILDLHIWRMLLDLAMASRRGVSLEEKTDKMRIMDEKYYRLLKDLRLEGHALHQAAAEDKMATISNSLRIAKMYGPYGSSTRLEYLRATYVQSWLSGHATSAEMELKKFEYIDILGQGGCGVVNKVKWLGFECALKMLGGRDEKEATALKGLCHPNIIHLLHYWEDRPEDPQSRLLMELMPKDLGGYMKDRMRTTSSLKWQEQDSLPFSLPVAIDVMYQIAQAMQYMHDRHLAHRDLKPSNILVKERWTCNGIVGYLDVKLADFGLVKAYKNTSTFHAHSGSKGTGLYRAPEMFGKDMSQKIHYLQMADVWSFGITCVEILSGKEAYAKYVDKYGLTIQTKICKEGLRPTLPRHCPEYLSFCIKSCLEYSPTRRPTFSSLCKLLRHAKLLSLGVAQLESSKFIFAYLTRSGQVNSLHSSSSLLPRRRISTFFQSSLKLVGIGSRPVPSVSETVLVFNVGHEEQVVTPPIFAEDSPLAKEESSSALGNSSKIVKSILTRQEPMHQSQASKYNASSFLDTLNLVQFGVVPQEKLRVESIGSLMENLQRQHFGREVLKRNLMFPTLVDLSEGRKLEPELPSSRQATSASNPSPLQCLEPWNLSLSQPEVHAPLDNDSDLYQHTVLGIAATRKARAEQLAPKGCHPLHDADNDDTRPHLQALLMAATRAGWPFPNPCVSSIVETPNRDAMPSSSSHLDHNYGYQLRAPPPPPLPKPNQDLNQCIILNIATVRKAITKQLAPKGCRPLRDDDTRPHLQALPMAAIGASWPFSHSCAPSIVQTPSSDAMPSFSSHLNHNYGYQLRAPSPPPPPPPLPKANQDLNQCIILSIATARKARVKQLVPKGCHPLCDDDTRPHLQALPMAATRTDWPFPNPCAPSIVKNPNRDVMPSSSRHLDDNYGYLAGVGHQLRAPPPPPPPLPKPNQDLYQCIILTKAMARKAHAKQLAPKGCRPLRNDDNDDTKPHLQALSMAAARASWPFPNPCIPTIVETPNKDVMPSSSRHLDDNCGCLAVVGHQLQAPPPPPPLPPLPEPNQDLYQCIILTIATARKAHAKQLAPKGCRPLHDDHTRPHLQALPMAATRASWPIPHSHAPSIVENPSRDAMPSFLSHLDHNYGYQVRAPPPPPPPPLLPKVNQDLNQCIILSIATARKAHSKQLAPKGCHPLCNDDNCGCPAVVGHLLRAPPPPPPPLPESNQDLYQRIILSIAIASEARIKQLAPKSWRPLHTDDNDDTRPHLQALPVVAAGASWPFPNPCTTSIVENPSRDAMPSSSNHLKHHYGYQLQAPPPSLPPPPLPKPNRDLCQRIIPNIATSR